MMTDKQRYLFDLQGFLKIESMLPRETCEQLVRDLEAHGVTDVDNDPSKSRFRDMFLWDQAWRDLIDHPTIMPILQEMLGERFRLDSAYGMAASAKKAPANHSLHHEAGMFYHGCYYVTHNNVMHNGLIVVSFALTDIEPGAGGFGCIPGSHKAIYKTPDEYFNLPDNPLAVQVPQKAGDVVIFTEALTHGTMPWTSTTAERRSVLLKYCPHYMQWTPGLVEHDDALLTERQRLIVRGPYVRDRELVEV